MIILRSSIAHCLKDKKREIYSWYEAREEESARLNDSSSQVKVMLCL